jgi:hypothetical protein
LLNDGKCLAASGPQFGKPSYYHGHRILRWEVGLFFLVKSRVICARLPGLVLFAFLISSGLTALAATSSSQLVAKTPNAGVVLASFRNSDNAEKLMQELGSKFGAGEISLGILSAQSDDRPLYRVVAQADGVDSREFLQRMRRR